MAGSFLKPVLDTVGKRIRWMRKNLLQGKKGINLAADLKISTALLSSWENDNEMPPTWRLRQLAEKFRCSVAYLLKGDMLPLDGAPLKAHIIKENLAVRLRVALGSPNTTPRVLCLPQLLFVIEPCSTTLLDLEALDKGLDMIEALPVLDEIIAWGELAWNERIPGADVLLFEACDRAVHFKCFVVLADKLVDEVTPYFGKMNRVAYLKKALHARVCARWGDVYKICAVENPKLAGLALEYFEKAWIGEGRSEGRFLDYHAFRSPSIIAGSLPMSDSDFEKYLARLDDGIQSGRFMQRTEVHLVEGRSETNAQRYKLRPHSRHKQEALKDMHEAQRLARMIGEQHGKHNEIWLRTERLEITLWNTGIRDHISSSGMSAEAAIAQKADEVYRHAKEGRSDRLAAAMLKQIQKVGQ